MNLRQIDPPGIIPTVLRGLRMAYMPLAFMDVTDEVQLGGLYSPALLGMTPANLAINVHTGAIMGAPLPFGVPNPMPNNLLPHNSDNTRPSPNANNPGNWAM